MTDFFLDIPSKVLFGLDAINRIGSFTGKPGDRVLIVTEAILYEQETIARLQGFLEEKQIQFITFDEVVPNATSTCIDEGVKLARVSKINMIIGLGGMRTLSAAKCIAMATNGKHAVDEYLSGQKPDGEAVPYIEIPTTCRNPFMLTDEYLVTDARTRKAFIGKTQPGITKNIIIDPQLAETLPLKYFTSTLMDTLLNALEGYISLRSNFLSDSFFLKSIELICQIIHALEDRTEMLKFHIQAATAGFLAALGHTMCRPGLGAAIAYALNSRRLIPKSWTSAILMPHIIEFNYNACMEKMQTLGRLLGEELAEEQEPVAMKRLTLAVQRILAPLQLPARFGEFDMKIDDMIEIAENAYSFDYIQHLPRGMSIDDIYNFIKAAF